MGWLLDLAAEGPRKLDSTNEIASAMLDGLKLSDPKVKALGNRVRHLDDGDPTWWLKESRSGVRAKLSAILGITPDELLERTTEFTRVTPSLFHLVDLPGSRPLDLKKDGLFPGIPSQVMNPDEWARTWWTATDSTERALVGAWLQARGLATFIEIERLVELSEKLQGPGPFFVEVAGPMDRDALRGFSPPPEVRLCFAAPWHHSEPAFEATRLSPEKKETSKKNKSSDVSSELGSELEKSNSKPNDVDSPQTIGAWADVKSESPETWIDPLTHWIASLLRNQETFDPAETSKWLEDLFRNGSFNLPSEALALVGMRLSLGIRLGEMSFQELADEQIRRTVSRSSGVREDFIGWLFEHGTSAFQAAITLALSRAEDLSENGLSEREWISILRKISTSKGGIEAARTLVKSGVANGLTKEQVAILDKTLAPDPFGLLETVIRLGILVEGTRKRFVVRPAWFAHVLTQSVLEALFLPEPQMDLPPFGRILMQPQHTSSLISSAIDRVVTGNFRFVEECLTRFEASPQNLAAVAGVEGAFRVVGLAIIAAAQVDRDLLIRLWKAQSSLAIARWTNWPPFPRVMLAPVRGESDWVLTNDAFLFAAWAISETIGAEVGPNPPEMLAPWTSKTGAGWKSVACLSFDRDSLVPEWARRGSAELLGRLFDIVSRFGRQEGHVPEFFVPAALVAGSRAEFDVDEHDLMMFGNFPYPLERLSWEAERQKTPLESVVGWLWFRWTDPTQRRSGSPPPLSWMAERKVEYAQGFWELIPPDLLKSDEKLVDTLNNSRFGPLIWEIWGTNEKHRIRWENWLDTTIRSLNRNGHGIHSTLAAWKFMPKDLVASRFDLMNMPDMGQALGKMFWELVPDDIQARLEVDAGSGHLNINWLWHTPSEKMLSVLEIVDDLMKRGHALDEQQKLSLLGWLHQYVAVRHPGYERAHSLLFLIAPLQW